MLAALRQSAHSVSRLLVPLLLLSWIALGCGNCFAAADTLDAAHDHAAMMHADHEHGCCDHQERETCLGSGCDHAASWDGLPTATLQLDSPSFDWVLVSSPYELLLSIVMTAHVASGPPPLLSDTSSPPAYLRNCTFLI